MIAGENRHIGTLNVGTIDPIVFTLSALLVVPTGLRTIAARVGAGGYLGTFPADAQVSLYGVDWTPRALDLRILKLEDPGQAPQIPGAVRGDQPVRGALRLG